MRWHRRKTGKEPGWSLWIADGRQIDRYDPRTGQFTPFRTLELEPSVGIIPGPEHASMKTRESEDRIGAVKAGNGVGIHIIQRTE